MFVSTAQGEASCGVDNHVELVRDQHQHAIKKGEVAAKVWKVERDIMAAKDLCIMRRPTSMPSTTDRQPVRGDLVRPKHVPKDHGTVCLPLRFKKFEDDAKCGWEMAPEDAARVWETDEKNSKFRLVVGENGRQSAMTPWQNWRYDDSVLTRDRKDIINLKTDCEKVVFSLYSIQTDIKDTSLQIQDLNGKKGDHTITSAKKLEDLQDQIKIANERLEQIRVLKQRYDRRIR